VVGFGAGEPDFDTPDHIKAAAKKALDDGTQSTPRPGAPELKDAIIAKLKRTTAGVQAEKHHRLSRAKHSIFNVACCAFLEAGDEVIIPAPVLGLLPDIALLADATR